MEREEFGEELSEEQLEHIAGGVGVKSKKVACPRCGASGGQVEQRTAIKWYCKKCKDIFTG